MPRYKRSNQRPDYVLIDDSVSSYNAIAESSDNKLTSGRHMLRWIVGGASKVIMVDEVMDANVHPHEDIAINDVDIDPSKGIAGDLLNFMIFFW